MGLAARRRLSYLEGLGGFTQLMDSRVVIREAEFRKNK